MCPLKSSASSKTVPGAYSPLSRAGQGIIRCGHLGGGQVELSVGGGFTSLYQGGCSVVSVTAV